jgi:glycosyltransferase involved in cell wall biosynthesis
MMEPRRIAYVVKRYPRYSETFIVNEILAHEAAGLSLEIFSLLPPVDTHFQNVISQVRAPVHYLPCEGPKASDLWNALQHAAEFADIADALAATKGEIVRDIHQALVLARAVRVRGIHHLHAHFASSATTVARLAARLAGVPYSFTAHAKDIFHEDVSADDLRRKLEDAHAVITVSDFNAEFLRREFGEAAGHVARVYNGLDLARFPFASPAERERRIVAVGRLVEKKGFATLIDACALLAKRSAAFHCQIIGTGELEHSLLHRITELGLTQHVELLGPRPQSEIVAEIQRAAIFAAPCLVGDDGNRDGLPTVLLEAMAAGTPCVSTDVTGIPEVLKDNVTGLMIPQHDANALAEAIKKLLGDPALRVRLAAEARALIEREFDIRVNAARQRELFFAPRPDPAVAK